MSIKEYLFKPKWQHKDPAVRREAVASEEDPDLMEALPRICLDDEDVEVRMAAARRLRDLATLLKARDQAVAGPERELLNERVRQLATATGADRPPAKLRLQAVESSTDRALHEAVAAHAPERELRLAALAHVERQGLLGDIAIGDPDPELRRAAAARIRQHSTLQRVIDATRKSDKALHQALLEQLHREQLKAGDPGAVASEALRICEELERIPRPAPERIDELKMAFAALADLATPAHKQRFQGALARLAPGGPVTEGDPADEAPPAGQPTEVEAKDGPAAETGSEPAGDPPPAAKSDAQPAERATKPARPAPTVDWDELGARVDRLQGLLDEGELHAALVLRGQILEAGKPLGRQARWKKLQQRVNGMYPRLRELRDWLHWSNNKIRNRLVREMAELASTDLHPDAVLARIKELQAEWKRLEASEQIPGDRHYAAPPKVWRQFQAAGRAAFEHAKPFLDKRSELQQQRVAEIRELCQRVDELAAEENPDWVELRKAAGRAGGTLRKLGELPARERKKTARIVRRSLDRANARLDTHNEGIELAKRQLIREAAKLEFVEDRATAISQAKSLQAEWKRAGSLPRGREQRLWKEFRQPLDPLFEQEKGEQDARRQAQHEALAAQAELVSRLEALLEVEDAELEGLQGKLRGLEDAWRDIPRPAPRHQQAFGRALETFSKRLARHRGSRERARRERWWAKADLLHELESGCAEGPLEAQARAGYGERWPEGGSDEIDAALDSRRDAALEAGYQPDPPGEDELDQARLLCIRLEFLAGLPSPEEDRARRMQYQVDRLSRTMSGEREQLAATDEARRGEREWLLLGWLPDPEHAALRARVRAALDALELDN